MKKFFTETILFHVTVISLQDTSLFQESVSDLNSFSPQGPGSSASVIPYPTRNLSFYNGELAVWDGRWQRPQLRRTNIPQISTTIEFCTI